MNYSLKELLLFLQKKYYIYLNILIIFLNSETMVNFKIETDESVYTPSEDSYLLGENLDINYGETVLEIGTGSGIVAMFASKLTNKVTATDINFNAIELAEKNFKLNGIENIELLFGNLFEVVKNRKFDIILFNTPYLPTTPDEILDDDLNYAFDGGEDGRKVIDTFLENVKNHLNSNGKIQLIQSSLTGNEKTLKKLKKLGFESEIAKKEHYFFEDIVLINAYLK
jgi:release factor glutamine methyltransferase